MSEENKTAEEIKNVPETIYLLTSQHVENSDEDDNFDFGDFSTEYVYWSEGESNDPYDTNYILKAKYDQQQEINAELQKQNAELVEALKILKNEASDLYDHCIDRGYLDNEDLTEGQESLLSAFELVNKVIKHTT